MSRNGKSAELTAVIGEDDYLVSREVARAARSAGISVLGVAADGEEALALVKQHSPSVAILDIQMPHLTGLQAAHRIALEHPTPVVILSAFESGEFIRGAAEMGVGAYLTKPPVAAELGRAVEIAVARHFDLMEVIRLNRELQQALEEVRTLSSILQICMQCKKIRDEDGHWQGLESYICSHTSTQFSHGFCPECFTAQMVKNGLNPSDALKTAS